jgi:hypothetical protein
MVCVETIHRPESDRGESIRPDGKTTLLVGPQADLESEVSGECVAASVLEKVPTEVVF